MSTEIMDSWVDDRFRPGLETEGQNRLDWRFKLGKVAFMTHLKPRQIDRLDVTDD